MQLACDIWGTKEPKDFHVFSIIFLLNEEQLKNPRILNITG